MAYLSEHIYNFSKILKISYKSLRRRALRSALSILGIICGVSAVLAMISIGEGAKQKVIQQIGQLGMRTVYIRSVELTDDQKTTAREHLSGGLSLSDRDRIQAGFPHIRDIACVKETAASVLGMPNAESPTILAATPNYKDIVNLHIQEGRFISDTDIQLKHQVCVAGSGLAERMGRVRGVGGTIRIEGLLFKIVGIIGRQHETESSQAAMSARNYNETVFIPLGVEKYVSRVNKNSSHELSEIIVEINDIRHISDAETVIGRIMEVSHHSVRDYQIIVPLELLKQAERIHRTLNLVLSAIAGIALFVGGIGVMNIMLVSVSERTKEIGVRRAVGATRTDILVQFLTESVLLCAIGGVAGIAAGALTVQALSVYADVNARITAFAILTPLTMSAGVGLFFGLFPAYKASGMDPVAALRSE